MTIYFFIIIMLQSVTVNYVIFFVTIIIGIPRKISVFHLRYPTSKALIRSVMTYACPSCDFAADTHLFILKLLQNKVLRTFGKFPRNTLLREMHMAFQVPYIYE
jgi:hypothetical protein